MSGSEQCPPGKHCVNVEQVKGVVESSRQELRGEVRLLKSLVDDLRADLGTLPQRISDQLRDDRNDANVRFARGQEHFREMYGRLNKIERAVLALWIVVGIIAVGKAAGMLWPLFSKLFGG